MLRLFLVATLGFATLVGTTARADKAADDAFQAFVTQSAAHDNRTLEAWWSANLDNDPAPERVALLCSTGNSERQGFYIVEKDATHRWELSFDVDNRTRGCQKVPASPPAFEARTTKTVDVYQAHVEGHEQTSYALRGGRLVIVREEDVPKAGAKPKITDWDQIIKSKKKGAAYQTSDRVSDLNGH